MLNVSLLVEAADEFDAASDWYEERESGLGRAFREAVKSTLNAVSDNPRRFPRIPGASSLPSSQP